MSGSVTAEWPSALPPLPTARQVADLSDTLERGYQSARASARALRLQWLKAKLAAMRLAPPPATPRDAVASATEAARLAREAKAAGAESGLTPAEGQDVDAALAAAAAVLAKARRAVKPGSPEDLYLRQLTSGLAAPDATPSAVDLQV